MSFIGKKIDGRYDVHALVDTDDIFKTYRCSDTINNQYVFVKVFVNNIFELNNAHINTYSYSKKSEIEHSLDILMTINSPSVQKVLDYCLGDNFQYIVSEYIDDISLHSFFRNTKEKGNGLEWTHIKNISTGLCAAVKALHERNLIHGSISPSVIMMRRTLGFNYPFDIKLTEAAYRSFVSFDNTNIGAFSKQRLLYDAPELLKGKPITIQSDIYSIGVVLYKIVKGKIPFENKDNITIALNKKKKIQLAYNETIPKGFCQIVEHALEPDESNRYNSINEMCDDLEKVISDENFVFDFKGRKPNKNKFLKAHVHNQDVTENKIQARKIIIRTILK